MSRNEDGPLHRNCVYYQRMLSICLFIYLFDLFVYSFVHLFGGFETEFQVTQDDIQFYV